MKKLKSITYMILALGVFGLALPKASAIMYTISTLDGLTKAGLNSIWVKGEVASCEDGKDSMGWDYQLITIKADEVLKGQTKAHNRPGDLGERVQPSNAPKEVKIKMVGRCNGPSIIKGLPRLEVGEKGVFGFYGDSSRGFTTPISGEQGIFKLTEENGQKYLSNGMPLNVLDVANIQFKSASANPAAVRGLRTLQSAAQNRENKVPEDVFMAVFKQLLSENYENIKAEVLQNEVIPQ